MNQNTALKAKIIEIAKAGIGWLQKQKVNTVKEAARSIGRAIWVQTRANYRMAYKRKKKHPSRPQGNSMDKQQPYP